MRSHRGFALCGLGLLAVACVGSEPTSAARAISADRARLSANETEADVGQAAFSSELAAFNEQLLAAGIQDVRIAKAELLLADTASWQGATTLLANDRTHLTLYQFVPSDPRRGGSASVRYLVDQSDGNALTRSSAGTVVVLPNSSTEPAIDASMETWRTAPACPAPDVEKVTDDGSDPDVADGLVLGNPALIGTPHADVTHAGWLPGSFFDLLIPNGRTFILGVTLTFQFVNNGEPTDIDFDGHPDVAFQEIYYNRSFAWGVDGRPVNVDVQTVATHESGHGYGLGHFGRIFLDQQGRLKFAPFALMNAGYTGLFHGLAGTDNASFCSAWANAP